MNKLPRFNNLFLNPIFLTLILLKTCIFPVNPVNAQNVNSPDQATQSAMKEALFDEYKAQSLYQAIIDKFGQVRPFINIVNGEVRHAQRLETLMTRYGMEIPENPFVGNIQAPNSLQEACQIGVEAEIENLEMYDQFLTFVEENDIKNTFQALRDASEYNHLPAFQRCQQRLSR